MKNIITTLILLLSLVLFAQEDMNWITTKTYDINGNVTSNSKSYFDELGKHLQTQSLDIKTGSIWASQTLYDSKGRPALNTLSAPINSSGTFTFKSDFIKNSGNTIYSKADFEGNPESPTPVGTASNTLGWYYSSSNTNENYQDITSYPFSRTIYSELNPGAALKTIGGNKRNGEWKQGYTFSMPAGDELTQPIAFGDLSYQVSSTRKIIKTVSKDAHNIESVVFTDTDGKTLAAARVGESVIRDTEIIIGAQGFVDIHVPEGTIGIDINNLSQAQSHTPKIYNLTTEERVFIASTLPPGFYRVIINNLDLDTYQPEIDPITVTCKENYYDYSLNEYDEAGRLIASYQPVGITKAEKPVTTYTYNALGQLLNTTSPDEGTAEFKYRKDGQIRFSQNSKQVLVNEFSYTNYDDLGRPVESGVAVGTFSNLDPDAETFTFTSKSEQNYTSYDLINDSDWDYLNDLWHDSSGKAIYGKPSFLAGNVAKTHNDNTTTYYSYDIYGRVEWIVQKIPDFGFLPKTIDYTYDPITGAVTKVDFQKNVASERFIHRYTYDPDDYSLVQVETSTDNSNYTSHAIYEYYETGALKRVNIAEGLQDIDYVYNLNGQLKAINPTGTARSWDIDDLFSMQIDYNSHDYARTQRSDIETKTYGEDQFNGNIKGVRWNNKEIENGNANVFKTYSYYYNKNNWLENAIYGDYTDTGGDGTKINIFDNTTHENVTKNFNATNSVVWLPGFHAKPNTGNEVTAKIVTGNLSTFQSGEYNVFDITYDANGNIRTLNRNKDGSGNNAMDYLNYTYKPDKPNQLLRVDDAAGEVLAGKDIGDQDGDNYEYNAIGQLIKNDAEGIEYVYNASGLVTEIKKDLLPLVKFFYNDKGHRVKKEIYTINGGTSSLMRTDYYVRDAAGTALAIYEGTTVKEHTIYGASRLGVFNRTGANTGSSVYQLTDHLGNVRAVAQWNGANAEAIVATDYYPFGMPMPNRDNGANSYRYAYQGQEKDPETGKEAFQLRLWDARIGRWLTTDPAGQYTSPYLGMGNNPTNRVDPDGGFDEFIQNEDGTFSKISDLGGNEVDFYHLTQGSNAGKTFIASRSGSAWMSTSKFILGFTQRNNNTEWNSISNEYLNGSGPENSIMFGLDQPMNKDLSMSYVAFRAREKFLNSGGNKVAGHADFGLAGILRSNVNMTEQMVGTANYSVYPLGDDEVMIAIFDSKSRYSLYYHLPWVDNWDRRTISAQEGIHIDKCLMCTGNQPYTTTRQTYIWIESVENLQNNHYLYDSRYDSDY